MHIRTRFVHTPENTAIIFKRAIKAAIKGRLLLYDVFSVSEMSMSCSYHFNNIILTSFSCHLNDSFNAGGCSLPTPNQPLMSPVHCSVSRCFDASSPLAFTEHEIDGLYGSLMLFYQFLYTCVLKDAGVCSKGALQNLSPQQADLFVMTF